MLHWPSMNPSSAGSSQVHEDPLSPGHSLIRYPISCDPPPWAKGGHAQTLWGHFLPQKGPKLITGAHWDPILVSLADGDRLSVLTAEGSSSMRVILFHGLAGDVNSGYLRRTAALLRTRGHSVWAVNHRGCGEGLALASKPYHSGITGDMQAVLRESHRRDPQIQTLVIGFSLSGNIALLYGAQGLDPQPLGFIAVNPPTHLANAAEEIALGFNRLYQLRFIRKLRGVVRYRERRGMISQTLSIPLSATLREFDDLYTAPESGFHDAADYYDRCSSLPRLHEIETSTVIITAEDDPFVKASVYQGAKLSPAVLLHVESHGGHMGYLKRSGWGWRRWLDDALLHYLDELGLDGSRE